MPFLEDRKPIVKSGMGCGFEGQTNNQVGDTVLALSRVGCGRGNATLVLYNYSSVPVHASPSCKRVAGVVGPGAMVFSGCRIVLVNAQSQQPGPGASLRPGSAAHGSA